MAYEFRNKAIIREKQNLIDISIQEYGSADAIFTLIDLNPSKNFTIDSVLDSEVTKKIFADNQTEEQTELVSKFSLENRIIVNEDDADVETVEGGAFDSGFDGGYS